MAQHVDEELLFEVEGGVATISLNRPDKRNSFTDAMAARWIERLAECASNDEERDVVFAGKGGAFCAGGDLGGLADKAEQTPAAARERIVSGTQALVRRIASMEKPLIAAVDGVAVGGGMDLALLCDVRLASERARFSESYAKVGLVPGVGGAFLLPRIVGEAAALDLFWTGRWVDAPEALALGLVNRVFATENFSASVAEYAHLVAGMAPLAVKGIKRLVRQAARSDLTTHLDGLASDLALIRTSEDHREALSALREKRIPRFTGR